MAAEVVKSVTFGTRAPLYISDPGHADNGISAALLYLFNPLLDLAKKMVQVQSPNNYYKPYIF